MLATVRGDLDDAVAQYQSCLSMSRATEDATGQARVYHNLGMTHADRGDFKAAMESYERAFEIAQDAGQLDVQANIYLSRAELLLVGQYYLKTGQDEKALWVLEEARDKSNKNSIAHNDPLLMLELAWAYYRINRYDECLQILMSLSEVFPGLRSLQNSVQGVYAARQKSGGEVRINQ